MSLEKDIAEIKTMVEAKPIFKGASKGQLVHRHAQRKADLVKKGAKVTYLVDPEPGRDYDFWYDGDVAEISYTHPTTGEVRKLTLTAQGEIRVKFIGDDTYYRDWTARDEARDRGYTDANLTEPLAGEAENSDGKVDNWENNNWFEFFYESSKWEGRQDIMGDVMGSYSEGIETGIDLITDDHMWKDLTQDFVQNESINEAIKNSFSTNITKIYGESKNETQF